jgi:hypothetical protein
VQVSQAAELSFVFSDVTFKPLGKDKTRGFYN